MFSSKYLLTKLQNKLKHFQRNGFHPWKLNIVQSVVKLESVNQVNITFAFMIFFHLTIFNVVLWSKSPYTFV